MGASVNNSVEKKAREQKRWATHFPVRRGESMRHMDCSLLALFVLAESHGGCGRKEHWKREAKEKATEIEKKKTKKGKIRRKGKKETNAERERESCHTLRAPVSLSQNPAYTASTLQYLRLTPAPGMLTPAPATCTCPACLPGLLLGVSLENIKAMGLTVALCDMQSD